MKWHAPHPANQKLPACGTVGEDGRPTHRVATTLKVTCRRCLAAVERLKPPNARVSGAGTASA